MGTFSHTCSLWGRPAAMSWAALQRRPLDKELVSVVTSLQPARSHMSEHPLPYTSWSTFCSKGAWELVSANESVEKKRWDYEGRPVSTDTPKRVPTLQDNNQKTTETSICTVSFKSSANPFPTAISHYSWPIWVSGRLRHSVTISVTFPEHTRGRIGTESQGLQIPNPNLKL